MERRVVDAIGDGTGVGFNAIVAQLDEWSARCIAAGAFPPDALKRAAGERALSDAVVCSRIAR